MLKITTKKDNYINERKYIIDVLFGDFLQCDYNLEFAENATNWQITLPNSNTIEFSDAFFGIYEDYLIEKALPKHATFAENPFTPEKNIPIIYGNEKTEVSENSIHCGIDVFASSFFMLTRWEEYVNKARDAHDRFPAIESVAFKNNFLERPVVNEYVEMIRSMFDFLSYHITNKRKMTLLLTHDIDQIYKYYYLSDGIRDIGRDIIKKHEPLLALEKIKNYLMSHVNHNHDPFNSFDFIMNESEKINLKSHFFFMGTGTSKYDNFYDIKARNSIKLAMIIKNRGHILGFHPSYNAYNDTEQFKKEKQEIEEALKMPIICGREHFLRFEAPKTWQIWEDNGMKWDTTLSYADHTGFRCGTCYDFPVYNFLTRRQLNLREKPLIVMEATLLDENYRNVNDDKFLEITNKLMNDCKKYKGEFVLLWHNSRLTNKRFKDLYRLLLKSYDFQTNFK